MTPLTAPHIAKAVHEIRRTYRIAMGKADMGDWHTFPREYQNIMLQRIAIAIKDRLTYTTAGAWQTAWAKPLQAEGWKHGQIFDKDKKIFPWAEVYEKVPQDDRVMLDLEWALVRALEKY